MKTTLKRCHACLLYSRDTLLCKSILACITAEMKCSVYPWFLFCNIPCLSWWTLKFCQPIRSFWTCFPIEKKKKKNIENKCFHLTKQDVKNIKYK